MPDVMPLRSGQSDLCLAPNILRAQVMSEKSNQIRRLTRKWQSGQGWPKRLEWLELEGLRGWSGQRIEFAYPITAIVGENGSGKSTVLQAAAAIYLGDDEADPRFASEFFPDTAWDQVRDAKVRFGVREGDARKSGSIRKPTTRWLGNLERPNRHVTYIDLSRIQPVGARSGYSKIVKSRHTEASARAFEHDRLARLSHVMGRNYEAAKMALTNIDKTREIPVVGQRGNTYSGFHQGSGEIMIAELLQADFQKYGLIIIDEIESSLHPRAQRRLMRELAELCRERDLQILLTTHSPFVLEELPSEARVYLMDIEDSKRVMVGVSPMFAMSQMDDEPHPECELFVEDVAAKVMLGELLAAHAGELFVRCSIVPFGAASVGRALGIMASQKRFPRPTVIFLDADNPESPGCVLLPGGDAPERVVFESLRARSWGKLAERIGRRSATVSDALSRAMTVSDHHEWITLAATTLQCGGDTLWQNMCAEWSKTIDVHEVEPILDAINDVIA